MGGQLGLLYEPLAVLALPRDHNSGHTGPSCSLFSIVRIIATNKEPMHINYLGNIDCSSYGVQGL